MSTQPFPITLLRRKQKGVYRFRSNEAMERLAFLYGALCGVLICMLVMLTVALLAFRFRWFEV